MPDYSDTDTQPSPVIGSDSTDDGWVLGGRYRVLDRLGDGGMAEVFRAHDQLLDRDVAVKVFRTFVDPADTQGELRRELELQSLAQLNHPNLVTLFDGSVTGDGPGYLVLELVQGADLAARLREGPLPESEVREIGEQIASALSYVHAHGMVHRDVKPANILLGTESGLRARLSDFGVVRMLGAERLTAADLTLGTASYIAPEQARGSDVEPPADVYALGLVLIEALTGTRCFTGTVHEAIAARLTTAPPIPEGLPKPWPDLLAGMTTADPAKRPTAAEVAEALRAGVAPEFVPAPAPMMAGAAMAGAAMAGAAMAGATADQLVPAPEPMTDRRRRGHTFTSLPFLLAGAALLAIVIGAGYLLLGGTTQNPAQGTSVSSVPHRQAPTTAKHSASHRALTEQTSSTVRHTHASTTAAAQPSTSSVAVSSSSRAVSSPTTATTTAAATSSSAVSSSTTSTANPSPVVSGSAFAEPTP